jgi:hypothetical protein
VSYAYEDDEWDTTKAALRAFLISKARVRSVVPYSEVVSQIGPIVFGAEDFAFHRMLDEVSSEEDARVVGC